MQIGAHHMESRRSSFRVNIRCSPLILLFVLVAHIAWGQRVPLVLGELGVTIKNAQTPLYITAVASGNVGGSRFSWYPLTHDYDSRSNTTNGSWWLQHCDRLYPPGTGSNYFAYGYYKITVEGNFIYVDYRDAEYEDGNGGFGTGYSSADMEIFYNHNNGCFYKDAGLTQRIYSSIAIWEDNRKTGATPKIPVTVTNSMGVGDVTVGGGTDDVPLQLKWAVGTGVTIAAVSPQTFGGVTYAFASWSDGGAQSHTVTPALSQFGGTFTANFTVSSVASVTNLSVGGSTGNPVHISWTELANTDVDYHIYRKVKHNGVMGGEVYLATVPHGTNSYDDDGYLVIGHSNDLLYYDARAHHNPSGVYASGSWAGGVYGQPNTRKAAGEEAAAPVVTEYALGAHPNPFNPQTQISFDLPRPGQVSLTVYDMAGREVATLLKAFCAPGAHQVSWNGESASSGIYLLRLRVTDELGGLQFTKVHKLLLVK